MDYITAVVVFLCGEFVSLPIFFLLKKYAGPREGSPANKGSTLKGILERLTLYVGLLYGFPQIIIAFSALKLGTRLHTEKECDISNTYFLAGNLISILLSMLYTVIAKAL